MSNPDLSIILVNYNEREYLARVLEKLPQEFSSDTEIIVVDNDSRDGSADLVRQKFPTVKLIESGGNLMYAKGNNLGMERASGAWLLLMNPDVDWQPGQLKAFVAAAQVKPNLGAAGPRLLNPDGSLQRSAHHTFPSFTSVLVDYCLPLQQILLRTNHHPYLESPADHTRTHAVAHVSGICLLVSREVFLQTGGLDPDFSMYLEETEWQKRMVGSGLVNWLIAETGITHYGSAKKTMAQASRHFLWGLWHYTDRHWSGLGRHLRLRLAIWLATLLSLMLVLPLWPSSWFFGRIGRRLRYYAQQYLSLAAKLMAFPTKPPIQS
jgi:GT2 family glycosyltransferase